MSGSIHQQYNPRLSFESFTSSIGQSISPFMGRVTAGIGAVASGSSQLSPGTESIEALYDQRRQAMLQQLSYGGKLNPNNRADYLTTTKTRALGNFADLTDTQMEVAVMKNWEQRINHYIQIA